MRRETAAAALLLLLTALPSPTPADDRFAAAEVPLYLVGGIGSTKFAGDQNFSVNFGAGYRVLPTDWLAISLGVQDRVFDSDILGETKVTNNIETLLSATVFF